MNTPQLNKYLPAATPVIAQSPFQSVASDFCEFGGNHSLVTIDRFSNWPNVSSTKSGTPASGTKGLLSSLRSLFTIFGIPRKVQVTEDQNTPLKCSNTSWISGVCATEALLHTTPNLMAELKSPWSVSKDCLGGPRWGFAGCGIKPFLVAGYGIDSIIVAGFGIQVSAGCGICHKIIAGFGI